MLPLMILGGVLAFVSALLFIWLSVIAFKESMIWGLVTLFVPFGNVVFAVKHWELSKKPFIAGMACSVLAVGLMFGAFAVAAAQLQQQVMNDPEFQKAMADFGEMNFETTEGTGEVTAVAQTVSDDPVVAETEKTNATTVAEVPKTVDVARAPSSFARSAKRSSNRGVIRFDEASKHIGAKVRITGHHGLEVVAVLVETADGILRFERGVQGGAVTIEFNEREIEKLEILR